MLVSCLLILVVLPELLCDLHDIADFIRVYHFRGASSMVSLSSKSFGSMGEIPFSFFGIVQLRLFLWPNAVFPLAENTSRFTLIVSSHHERSTNP